jgi:hypothetical protein
MGKRLHLRDVHFVHPILTARVQPSVPPVEELILSLDQHQSVRIPLSLLVI